MQQTRFLRTVKHLGEVVMVGNNLFGHGEVCLQRTRRTVHCQTGEVAHVAKSFGQRAELLMERRAHRLTVGQCARTTSDPIRSVNSS